MEAFKPSVEVQSGTNVTVQDKPAIDMQETAFIFAKSLSKLLKATEEEKYNVPEPETPVIEQALPPTLPEAGEVATEEVVTERPIKSIIADTSLPIEAKAFLDTISVYESPDYNVIVGSGKYGAPATFSDYSMHPNVIGMRTIKGPSTAAGRYQIVYSTWKELQENYPGRFKDFSPISQDRAAWQYAQDIYKARTGVSLLEDLQAGNIKKARMALRKIWIGLGKAGEEDVSKTYGRSLKRYQE